MQKILICETIEPQLRTLFVVEQTKHNTHALSCLGPFEHPIAPLQVNKKLCNPPGLPNELVVNILKITIDWLLENGKLGRAFDTICSCRFVFNIYFDRYVGRFSVAMTDKIKMLNRVFRVATLFAHIVRSRNGFVDTQETKVICLNIDLATYLRFQFLAVKSLSHRYCDIHHPLGKMQFKKVHTGFRARDACWLFGQQQAEFFECAKLYRPAFVLQIERQYSADGNVYTEEFYPDTALWPQKRPFVLFADLLKKMYGPDTGVFMIVGEHVIAGKQKHVIYEL